MEALRPSELDVVRNRLAEWRLDLAASEDSLQTTFGIGDLFEYHRDRAAYLRPLIDKMSEVVEAHETPYGGT